MTVRTHFLAFLGLLLASCGRAQVANQFVMVEAHLDGCYADCPPLPLPSYYVFCFRMGDRTVIGGHQSWDVGLRKLASLEHKRMLIHYDDEHLWVKLPSGWTVKLNQYSYEYPFKDGPCRSEAQLRSLQHGYTRPAPVPGEPATPVMRGKLVTGWALCLEASTTGISECTVWDLNGDIRRKDLYEPVVGSTEVEDEAAGETYRTLHLGDGRVMKLRELILKRTLP